MKDSLDANTAQQLTQLLATSEKGLIIAGELPVGFDKVAFWKFAKDTAMASIMRPVIESSRRSARSMLCTLHRSL